MNILQPTQRTQHKALMMYDYDEQDDSAYADAMPTSMEALQTFFLDTTKGFTAFFLSFGIIAVFIHIACFVYHRHVGRVQRDTPAVLSAVGAAVNLLLIFMFWMNGISGPDAPSLLWAVLWSAALVNSAILGLTISIVLGVMGVWVYRKTSQGMFD